MGSLHASYCPYKPGEHHLKLTHVRRLPLFVKLTKERRKMAKITIKKVESKKPKEVGKGPKTVKDHSKGKVKPTKSVKAKNVPSNYGVK
jgi:hypothetical protein